MAQCASLIAPYGLIALPARLQPNSGVPEFGHFINWPKSETSDFGCKSDLFSSIIIRSARSDTPWAPALSRLVRRVDYSSSFRSG